MFHDAGGNVFLHFRAGRMTYANGVVTPDLHRGDLSFSVIGDTVELVWTSHTINTKISLPKGKTKVSFVEKCKSGRVLLFEVSEGESPSLHFFWLQDKCTAEDANHLSALQNALKPNEPVVKMADFVKIMENIPNLKRAHSKSTRSLTDIIFSPKAIETINENYDFFNNQLSQFLPGDTRSTLVQQINNPQVRVAVKALEKALSNPSGFNEVCRSNGLPESRATGINGFLDLIIDAAKKGK